jgi:hypothetical protein
MLPETLINHYISIAPIRFCHSHTDLHPVHATPRQQAQAISLARKISEIRPGVYTVGNCIVDLWRMGCTCKASRTRKIRGILPAAKPCPHFLALWVGGIWYMPDPRPIKYLETLGIQQPEIIATYCRASLPACYPPAPKGFRILAASVDYAELENLHTGTHVRVPLATIRQVLPFYA